MLRLLRGPLLAALKPSTGIVGLPVEPQARPLLMDLCRQMLGAVKVIPESAQYRIDVEKLAQQRLKVCEEESEADAIERRIGMGQIEELIDQARKELSLIPKMAEWKPWDVPANHVINESKDDWPEIPR